MTKMRLLILLALLALILAVLAWSNPYEEEGMLPEPVEGCDARGVCEYSPQYSDEHYQAWYKSQGYE